MYGPLWQSTIDRFEAIRGGQPIDQETFHRLLAVGGFSQTLVLEDRDILEPIIDWQIFQTERNGHSIFSEEFAFSENSAMPPHHLFSKRGRLLSVDFLRAYAYLRSIEATLPIGQGPKTIVEIGPGFGGLSRLLKLRWPQSTIFLIDLEPSLRISEYYIRQSFSDCMISRSLDSNADFILVDVGIANRIPRTTFDLAVNTWSLGEMPNDNIAFWFDFLQNKHNVKNLFCLNHFLASMPLNAGAFDRASSSYDWIDRFDARWKITNCKIDPYIHRCPILRSQHVGLAISATRLSSDAAVSMERDLAAKAASAVYRHQWLAASMIDVVKNTPKDGKRKALFNARPSDVTPATHFVLEQFTDELNVWRPDFESETFCALWNDIRLNRSPLSIRAMRIWLHLQWGPKLRAAGAPINHIFREEVTYAKAATGKVEDDPQMALPNWMKPYFTAPGSTGCCKSPP
ncbi:MAG: putative sugar O-methyltransferase [Pseudolabrys sp.]|nr:putative sugar O-methyltransferase [Pseudolabrys sp.]MDP2295756.1 putative sugar O-methyltransferase [Pseudolabrys sp.]